MKTKILSILALLLMTVTQGAWAQGPWTSGACTLTLSNGTMTVSGNGAMADYGGQDELPWLDYSSDITSVVVESGVTTIGSRAFYSCMALTSVTLPEGLTTINVRTFYNCNSLTTVTIPSTVTSINSVDAFCNCSSMTDVYLYADPANLTWPEDGDDFKDNKATKCHVLAEHLAAYQSNFSKVNVTFVGDLQPQAPADPAGPATSGIDWNPSTNSGTFAMPAYDVEVSTELWYILKQDGETPAANKAKANVFLDRTLQAKVGGDDAWNTFCVPFPISADKVTALGMTVKQLSSTSFSNGTLTLDFTDVTTGIAAGTPYLVRVASDLDFTADGNEFEGVSQDWATTHPVTPGTVGVDDWVTFVPVLTPTPINDNTKLYLGGARTLYYPSDAMTIKGFRAYFQLNNGLTAGTPAAGIRAFVLNLGDEETGIRSLTPDASPKGEGSIYTLDGRKVQNTTRKGIYIVNGKKVVVK